VRVSPGRIMERRKNRMAMTIRSMRYRVMGTAHDARDAVSDQAEGVVEAVKDAPDMMRERTQGAPLVAGGLAFGVGFLVAAAIPSTKMEKEAGAAMMNTVEPLKDELTDAGRAMAANLKEPATEAMESVKAVASEGAQAVAETGKSAVDETKQSAKDSVDAVKSST
jgi:ElaB/YqjD/DUF883 family membrane-anchored ribosome-binding protein